MFSHSSVTSASYKRKYTKAWKSLCLFSRSQAESQNVPPTRGALVQHVMRVHLQSIVWSMAGVAKPSQAYQVLSSMVRLKMLLDSLLLWPSLIHHR